MGLFDSPGGEKEVEKATDGWLKGHLTLDEYDDRMVGLARLLKAGEKTVKNDWWSFDDNDDGFGL